MLKSFSITLLSLLAGILILLYLNEVTLFLSALLLSVVSIRTQKNSFDFVYQTIGVWFALSVAPAIHLPLHEVLDIKNGFLLQALFSFIAFIIVQEKKPSLIGKLYREAKGAIALVGSTILAGFTAGIISAFVWQIILKLIS